MTDVNPYASPLSIDISVPDEAELLTATLAERQQLEQGLCRKGKQLVMHRYAKLPDRCVKSNEPTTRRLRRKLSWHHPAVFFVLLLNLLIYVIVAFSVRKQATIYIGLSDRWFRKRRRAILLGWSSALLGLVTFIGSLMIVSDLRVKSEWAGWGILLGVIMMIGGTIYGIYGSQIVAPVRITNDFIWLRGVHPAFLADLPEWPYRP